jgi:hypothetical protein
MARLDITAVLRIPMLFVGINDPNILGNKAKLGHQ